MTGRGDALVIFDEKIDPDGPGKAHDHGHEDHQGGHYGEKGIQQPCPKKEKGDHKGRCAEGDPQGIAYIHGAVEEGRFNFIFQPAMGTMLLHLVDFR